jgi:cysteinyl-tRNA synthetase
VYDKAHLGHARAYVSQDILRRVAERTAGYKVQLVMGVTDVDDKIIERAKEQGVGFRTLAREQEQQFFQDMSSLYVKPPTAITRVSEHLPEIIKYVEEIQKKGFAYEAVDGSGVYFSTQQLGESYGKLDPRRQSQQDADLQAQAVAAVEESDVVEEEEKVKKDPRDFALWKAAKEPDEPSWPSPWGRGRPGWHIECSAMTHHVLGDKLDVHTGGVDLRFPHHNNEIAQCEAHNHGAQCGRDEEWCKHFVHFGHLYIRGRKMSKSLKNFISVKDFLAEGHTADHFRLFCLQFKYRANLVYSEDRVRDAEAVADRLRGFFRSVTAYGGDHDVASSSADTQEVKSKRYWTTWTRRVRWRSCWSWCRVETRTY